MIGILFVSPQFSIEAIFTEKEKKQLTGFQSVHLKINSKISQ